MKITMQNCREDIGATAGRARRRSQSALICMTVVNALWGATIFCNSVSGANSHQPLLIAMTDEVRGMCQQAEQLINARQFSQAIQLLNQANGKDPNCPEVHGYLGMAYQNSAKTQQAIDEYRKALAINPSMTFLMVNLGTCYMNVNQTDLAVQYFQSYLQANPNAQDAAQVRSYIEQSGARKGEQNLRALVEKGQAFTNQKRYAEAKSAFQQAISLQPNFAPAHFYLAYALAQSGQNQQAITEFQTSLQLDPNLKEATLNIGSNYQSLGDIPNAITWYEKYLAENPGSPKSGEIRKRVSGLKEELAKKNGGSNQRRPQNATASSSPNMQNSMPSAATMPNPMSTPSALQPGGQFNNMNLQPAGSQYPASNQLPSQSLVQPGPTGQTGQAVDDYLADAAANGKFFRWGKMPIRIFIAPGAGTPGYQKSHTQALIDACSKWAQASENRVVFAFANNPSQADIVCSWTGDPNKIGDGGKSIEGGLTKLTAQAQPNGDIFISKAKVTILTNRSGKPLSSDDMKKVCLHEIGHALGINGHSANNRDVMFFSESPSVWPSLTLRDKATIRNLYFNYPVITAPN